MKIKGLYSKRGWFYYQAPTVNGERPPAIALKTKNEGDAVDRAYKLHTKNALHVQTTDRMDDQLALWRQTQLEAGIHTETTSKIADVTLGRLARDWNNPKVSAITTKMIKDWKLELQARKGRGDAEKMSDASIHSYLLRLKGFLSWLVNTNKLRVHPMEGMRFGRVKKTRREKFCTVQERERLLNRPPNAEIDFILHVGFFAGLRFGEILAMGESWLSPKEGGLILTVQETPFWKPKDKECRSIEVHPRLEEFLNRYGYKGKGMYLLAPYKDEWRKPPKYRYNPKKVFNRYCKEKDLEWVTYHTLRHTFASHLAMKGRRWWRSLPLLVTR